MNNDRQLAETATVEEIGSRGEIAFYRDDLSRTRMRELQICRMESNPSNSTFRSFLWTVLPVADYGMADGCKLHPDLIL